MKTKNVNAPFSIRFRRWSRAGYAVFCSLACTVTIGCVDISISDKSLQKAAGISENSLCAMADNSESSDQEMEILELESSIHQAQAASLFLITSDHAAACDQNTYIYFINQNG